MRPQPLSFTVTAFSRFSCGSTPAPPVNKPASQPSQPVSLPVNNNNCTGNFKGSRGIATFVVIFPSRFQWRERKHGCDVWSFEFNSLSGILELRYSLLYLPVFRYACCALDYSTYISFIGPSAVSTLPATSSANLPVVVGGSYGGETGSVSSRFPSLNKAFVVVPGYAPVLCKFVSKNFSRAFCRPGRPTSRQYKSSRSQTPSVFGEKTGGIGV